MAVLFYRTGKRIAAVCLLLFASLLFIAPTLAQGEDTSAVRVIDVEGTSSGSGSVIQLSVTGKVENGLAVDIIDVEVTVLLIASDDNADEELARIERVKSGGKKPFRIVASSPTRFSRFLTLVTDYRLDSEDVDLLLDHFWQAGDDVALRAAVAQTITELAPPDGSVILARLAETGEETVDDLIEDMLLLPVLSRTHSPEKVATLLDLAARYAEPDYLGAYAALRTSAEESQTIIPFLNEAAVKGLPLEGLIADTLYDSGDRVVPGLIEATYSAEEPRRQLALSVLKRMERDTAEAQLAVADETVRQQIIGVLGESYRPENVAPLLRATAYGALERALVVEALKQWGPDALPQIASGLNAPRAIQREVAAQLLLDAGEAALPAVQAALAREGLPPAADVSSGAVQLQRLYDERREAEVASLYDAGSAAVAAGDCTAAADTFRTLLTLNAEPSQDLLVMADAFACAGQSEMSITVLEQRLSLFPQDVQAFARLATSINERAMTVRNTQGVDAAISYLESKLVAWPQLELQNDLGLLYQSKAQEVNEGGDPDGAIALLQEAQETVPDSEEVASELGKLIVRREWKLLSAAMLVVTLAAIYVARVQRATLEIEER